MLDGAFLIDRDEVLRTVREAEVITFRFPTVTDRLLIDNRYSELDPPMVRLVEPAGSVEERFRSLKRLRPRFRIPDRISAIAWPLTARAIQEYGVWDAIIDRIATAGFTDAAERYGGVLRDLLARERREALAAVRGEEPYQVIWSRHA
ncbi:MAG TPA: hypothetical protein VNM43_05330 [Dehalococcoidia bacterium]|nr:hypothetical protein [Dehalococcoidia bacterium]